MKENNIQYIRIDRLTANPNNPRRDLGDLTTLADSIREQGILQNLTVVPPKGIDDSWDGYVVVVGHRRLAAAEIVGLEYVPCIIADLTPREQIAVMLLENIQRNDLTVLEQAHGFQMMLDMGDGYDDIAKTTGVSSATIRRRVKLLDYDENAITQGLERGAHLEDFALLEELTTETGKKAALATIGTVNFKWKVWQEKSRENEEKNWAATLEVLRSFAKEIDKGSANRANGYALERVFYFHCDKANYQPPQDDGEYYFWHKGDNAELYRWIGTEDDAAQIASPSNASAEDTEQQAKRAEHEDCARRRKLINEAFNRARALRIDFIRDKGAPTAQKNTIIAFAAKTMTRYVIAPNDSPSDAIMGALLDFEPPEDCDDNEEALCSAVDEIQNNYRKLLVLTAGVAEAYAGEHYNIYDNALHAKPQDDAREYYAFLESIGYQVSDEEWALVDGTHELFTPQEPSGGG